jgi:hypothetical protein
VSSLVVGLSREQCNVCSGENTSCSHYTVINGASSNEEYYLSECINVDNMVLLNLQDDIKELSCLLQSVTRSSGKEVIQHKVNMILVKMAIIAEDSTRNKGHNSGWTEVKYGRSKAVRKQCDQYAIPVINNQYVLLENHEEGCENTSLAREYQPTYGKVAMGKNNCKRNSSRVLFISDAMQDVRQHRLGNSFDVLGTLKPVSNLKEITNTLNLTVSSFTKKYVCIIRGGSCDVSKNENEYGLRKMKDLVTRQNLANLVVINIPYRHDLQESSCINSAVKNFNRKLIKFSKAFENLHVFEMEKSRDLYTNHGLHLNWKGIEVMPGRIVNVIKDIFNVQKSVPIEIKWKEEVKTRSIQLENRETSKEKNDQCFKDTKDNMQVNSVQGRGNGEQDNQAVPQPKCLHKVPIKRSSDFLWTD